MGLIRAGIGAATGVLADQWREYFYCDALGFDVLVKKGHKRQQKRSFNRKGDDNIISDGSLVAINEGQCMIIVDQGKVVEVCAEPGEFLYDNSSEPSLFYGELSENISKTFEQIGKRFSFGGDTAKDQRIYFLNTKELMGNKYGTPNPVPFRVVDKNIGLDIDISIRCHGEYSYKITNPILFYTNVCANVSDEFKREEIDSQLKTELMTALQPTFAKISDMGIRYSSLPGHTNEIAETLNDILSKKWKELRGIEIVSFGVNGVKASEEDEAMIKELQRNATFRNANMAAAHLVGAQAAAMQSAAKNEGQGSVMAFAGMNMASNAGGANIDSLFEKGQQQNEKPTNNKAVWICPNCSAENTGKFCVECGHKKPESKTGWTCTQCGTLNKGKFCMECGAKKPAGAITYKCDKCGWEPEDNTKVPKFCPECGDLFDNDDIVMK